MEDGRIELNIHSFPYLITSFLFIFLPLFLYINNPRNFVVKRFFLLGLCGALWQFPYFLVFNMENTTLTLDYIKIAYSGLIFIIPALFVFVSVVYKKNNIMEISYYLISFLLLLTLWSSSKIVAGVREYKWGYCASPGVFYPHFLIIWWSMMLGILVYLYKRYREVKAVYVKERTRYFIYSLIFACLAVLDIFPILGYDIYPIGFIFLVLFIIFTTYLVVKYRFLGVNIHVSKMYVFVMIPSIMLNLFYLFGFYFYDYMRQSKVYYWFVYPIFFTLFMGISLYLIILIITYLREKETRDIIAYRPVFVKESKRIARSRDIEELSTYIVRDISSWLSLEFVGMFIRDKEKHNFTLLKSVFRSHNRPFMKSLYLDFNNPIVNVLRILRSPVISAELRYLACPSNIEKEMFYMFINELNKLGVDVVIPLFCNDDLLGILFLGKKLSHDFIRTEEIELLFAVSHNISRALHDFIMKKDRAQLIISSQKALISAVESRDKYTYGHTERVSRYTHLIGKMMKERVSYFDYDISSLEWAAHLHDIGKIGISDSVLLKRGPLDKDEWEQIKQHPLRGIEIVNPILEWLGEDIYAGILSHHENFDGSGYPYGKKGKEIHIFARIIRVADSFDAMTVDRPYRKALSLEKAVDELERGANTLFDPQIVNLMVELVEKEKIFPHVIYH